MPGPSHAAGAAAAPDRGAADRDGAGVDVNALGLLLKQAQHRLHLAIDARLTALGTNLAQWAVLREVDRHPGASSTELADYAFQTAQSLGALVTRLADRGLLERRPAGGRLLQHHLTDDGRQLLRACDVAARQVHEDFFAPLDATRRHDLRDLLQGLTAGP